MSFSSFTKRSLVTVAGAVLCLFLAACSNVQVTLPAISTEATGRHYDGRVIWHDLLTQDTAAAKRFYGELFGWEFKALTLSEGGNKGGYQLITHNGKAIGGMIDTSLLRRDVKLVQWVSVFSSDDIATATANVLNKGGTVYTPVTDAGDRGQIAVVADEQGALFAILQTRDGDPQEHKPAIGEFLWDELWTDDSQKALAFYQHIFDYQAEHETLANGDRYEYLSSAGKPRAAVIKNPIDSLDPTWVTYVKVEDPAAICAQVKTLGGEVLLEPQANPIGGTLAIIRDPDGAGLVIQTWNR